MVFKEEITFYCEKYGNINTTWGKNAQYSQCEIGGIYSYNCALRG